MLFKHRSERAACSPALEIKTITPDGRFAGYASVFGIIDSQRDVVHKGAFLRSLKERTEPLRLLWQHQWNEPIGVIEKIFEDARGLYVEGRLLMEVARAREAFALLTSGILKGLSIGYTVKRYRRNPDSGVRELLDIDLWEISLVTLPANNAARVTVVKRVEIKLHELAALEKAIVTALPPPGAAMGIKSAITREQALGTLWDMAWYCMMARARNLEQALKAGYQCEESRPYARW